MSLLDQLTGVLGNYANANPQQPPPNAASDFDHVAQTAPPESLAEGLSHAFRSHPTSSFGDMVSQLFSQSNPQQRTGLLSTLLSSMGPAKLGQLSGQGGILSQLAGAFQQGQVSPDHANQVPPQAVKQMADQAAQQNPSVVDEVSHFYSQHPTLVKSLGAAAMVLAMRKIAERRG